MSAQRTIAKLRSLVQFQDLAYEQVRQEADAQHVRAILAEERCRILAQHWCRLPVWKS